MSRSGSTNFGKFVKMPAVAFDSMLFMARPITTIDLPNLSPASAIIFNLPRFEAKEVKIILLYCA